MELQNTKVSISASLTKSKEELASVVTSAAETTKVISCGTGLCRVRVLGKRPLLDQFSHWTLRTQCCPEQTALFEADIRHEELDLSRKHVETCLSRDQWCRSGVRSVRIQGGLTGLTS